jgi:DNA mismatch endonuclease, patch repair protein
VNRSEMMAAVRSKDTKPEMLVRSLLHRNGYRFRLHRADLPGKPDIVLSSKRKIIFVHGCFWHQHEDCPSSHVPRSNVSYWKPKLRRNQSRDKEHLRALRAAGWRCLVLWECELVTPERLLRRLSKFLG